ncbi:MAG: ribose-phosphate diphosphokinase [Hyphomicrobiales bacterium]
MILNLDQSFVLFPNETSIEYKSFVFSGGEPHIHIQSQLGDVEEVKLSTRIRSFQDMGLLFVAVDALKRMGINRIHLYLPYFPAARQDRVMRVGEPLSVKVYADILNSQSFQSITIFDPHSDVTAALLNNCRVVSNHKFISKVIDDIEQDQLQLVSPDQGALKKVYGLSSCLGIDKVVECSKHRDVKTLQLSNFKVYTEDLNQNPCLVVDDICDGGRTFIGLAKALKEKNAGDLYLAISHGIFSYGFEELLRYYKCVYTTDSFSTIEELPKSVKQFELKHIL